MTRPIRFPDPPASTPTPCHADELLAWLLSLQGLWHGRARLLASLARYELDEVVRWDVSHLEAFGGLYVTADRQEAAKYAHGAVEALNGHFGWAVAKPELHQVRVLPGALLALDEDELGWGAAVYAWQDCNPKWMENLWPTPRVRLALEGNGRQELEEELQVLADVDKDDYFDPADFADDIEGLTRKFGCEALRGGAICGNVPNFRILNDGFVAFPPLPPRMVDGHL